MQTLKPRGDWMIVCINTPLILQRIEKTSKEIVINIDDTLTFFAIVDKVTDDIKEEFNVHPGDIIVLQNDGKKIGIGSSKAGKLFAVSPADIVCVLDDADES